MSPRRSAGRRCSARRGLLAGVLILLSFWGFVLTIPATSAYTPHPPILIEGNQDFTPANGVTGGSGTASDPYIIEGWEIAGSGYGDNIHIENTDAHFIILGVFVHSNSSYFRENTGIVLLNITNGAIRDSNASDNGAGISIALSSNVEVARNTVTSNGGNWTSHAWGCGYGIRVASSTDVHIVGNTVTDNGDIISPEASGIGIESSTDVEIASNVVDANEVGIGIDSSSFVIIIANRVSGSRDRGIALESSTYVSMVANLLTSDGVTMGGHFRSDYTSHAIGPDNLVNGKPLRYYKDCSGVDIDGIDAGQVLIAGCRDVRVANLGISDTDGAVLMAFVEGAVIQGSDLGGTSYGTYVVQHDAVHLYGSAGVLVSDNSLWGNGEGVAVDNSTDVRVLGNAFWNNGYAMSIFWSSGISVANNTIDTGWPYQWGGGIHAFRSEDVTIASNNISRSGENIYVQDSNGVKIRCNHVADAKGEGVRLWVSTDITIVGNTVSNSSIGIRVFEGNTGVLAHHNNLLNSGHAQAQDGEGIENTWDDGYPSGGNHWSDYRGVDVFSGPGQDQPGSDGIGDTPYVIDMDSRDRYPLMDTASCPPNTVSRGGEDSKSLYRPRADVSLARGSFSNEGPISVAGLGAPIDAAGLSAPEAPAPSVSGADMVAAVAVPAPCSVSSPTAPGRP